MLVRRATQSSWGAAHVQRPSFGFAQSRSLTTNRDFAKTKLGRYPTPPEAAIWWKNRTVVPGGLVNQEISMFQSKIMFQYFHNSPGRRT